MSRILHDTIEHRDGVEWHQARKPFVLHKHRWQSRWLMDDGFPYERCACGAFGPRPWIHLARRERRVRWTP